MKLSLLCGLAVACVMTVPAQEARRISMSHVHLTVRDVAANQAFFALLGGAPGTGAQGPMVSFPGMLVILEKGEPAGGSVGSTINHFGFQVRNMKDWLPRWQAADLKMEPINRPTQVYLMTPDGVRVEILEVPELESPVAGHHIHFATQDIPGMQAWYAKTFGAIPGKRAQFEAADLPGINLTFSGINTVPMMTKGRALDHIAFEVRDLAGFVAGLEASGGARIDRPYRKISDKFAVATLTDPWGTRIELTEGLAPPR